MNTPQTDLLHAEYLADDMYSEDYWIYRFFQRMRETETQRDMLVDALRIAAGWVPMKERKEIDKLLESIKP